MNYFGHCIDEAFWSKSQSKAIFVPSANAHPAVFGFFYMIKNINLVIIHWKRQNENRVTTEMMTWDGLNYKMYNMSPSTNIDKVFSDKLRNMKQYHYKVTGKEQKPRLFHQNGTLYGYDLIFMDVVATKQNANFSIHVYESGGGADFAKLMINSSFDVSLNTINIGSLSIATKYFKTINTFDTEGFCALIPIPPRNSFLKYILTPYDWMSWMFMIISIAICATIWKVFKYQPAGFAVNHPGLVIFGIVANFLGQSISLRHSRWYHALVIQTFAFMMLILGNAYQSLLISLLSISRNGTRITTVNEMMEGNYNFMFDKLYHWLTTETELETTIYNLSNIIYLPNVLENHESLADNNTVLIIRCDMAHELIYSENYETNFTKVSDYYYILPEKLLTMYENFMTSRFCPFTERLEDISLQVFESGIKQHWKILMRKLTDQIDLDISYIINEDYMLKMTDLKNVFFIHLFGMFVALAVFLLELILHKFNWSMMCFLRKLIKKFKLARIVRIHPFQE